MNRLHCRRREGLSATRSRAMHICLMPLNIAGHPDEHNLVSPDRLTASRDSYVNDLAALYCTRCQGLHVCCRDYRQRLYLRAALARALAFL